MGFFSWLWDKIRGKTSDEAPLVRPVSPSPAAATSTRPTPRAAAKLDLDASAFLPISREEQKAAAAQNPAWGSLWFGRRDLIPPADDPRTQLVDRGMVSHGILSPEQLLDIHQVGAEMDRVRPTIISILAQAESAGAAAVQAERDRKAGIKEQKKRESAERKKLRAERIAQRHATDIVFLGRGVSGRLGDRKSDLAKLQERSLPELSTPAELTAALGLTIPQLRWLAFHAETARRIHYVQFQIPKKSGGMRTLSAPHRKLANAQHWILEQILNKVSPEDQAHGFRSGRGILSNAWVHAGRAIVVNMDLEDFFPNITFPRVRSVFHRLGYSPAVATILALLSTECPRRQVQFEGTTYFVATGPRGLPQGACSSPALSNLVARRLDRRLRGLAVKLGWTYTRYADDMTFSAGATLDAGIGYLMARVRHIAADESFIVNEKKSRVMRRSTAQKVTGLVVNDKPNISRKELRRLRAILHRARHEGLDAQNREHHPAFHAWLRGKLAYVQMVRPELGREMLEEMREVSGRA